jgi:hypothetical protein
MTECLLFSFVAWFVGLVWTLLVRFTASLLLLHSFSGAHPLLHPFIHSSESLLYPFLSAALLYYPSSDLLLLLAAFPFISVLIMRNFLFAFVDRAPDTCHKHQCLHLSLRHRCRWVWWWKNHRPPFSAVLRRRREFLEERGVSLRIKAELPLLVFGGREGGRGVRRKR